MTAMLEEQLQAAVRHHQAGRLAAARQLYEQILSVQPAHPDALHLSGLILHQAGDHARAAESIRKAISGASRTAVFHLSLGYVLDALGDRGGAAESYARALRLNPQSFEAAFSEGNVLYSLGRLDAALRSFEKARDLQPGVAAVWLNLGNTHKEMLKLKPALECYRKAAALQPDYAEAINNQGILEKHFGDLKKAIGCFQKVIELRPDYFGGYANLGEAWRSAGQYEDAVAACRKAVAINPNFATAWSTMGSALAELYRLEEASAAMERSLTADESHLPGYSGLGYLRMIQGQWADSRHWFEKALERKPESPAIHSTYLVSLHCDPTAAPESIWAVHQSWDERNGLGKHPGPFVHSNTRDKTRRLRVGYVSQDFRRHSVAYFLRPILAAHRRENLEVFCYASILVEDDFTAECRMHADQWRVIGGVPDEDAARMIREDGIDILIDLSGHTTGNRLLLFAEKPAPVQITYLGYPDTTGLKAMDWRITDRWADPEGATEQWHSERLLRLNSGFLCYAPDAVTPAIQPPPVQKGNPFTFGCFHHMAKINPPMIGIWARMLQQIPDSRLRFKNYALTDEATRQRLIGWFAAEGIGKERLELFGFVPNHQQHLSAYHDVDAAVDVYPYNGTTATCEALWMGVPTITLSGRTHCTRVGESLMRRCGLDELAATSADEYIAIARKLAVSHEQLSEWRLSMRERMHACGLTDGSRFVGELEQAYRRAWQAWCES